MSIFKTVESPPAGTGVKPGENPEIDAAVISGEYGMGGAIVNADGNYEVNGVELTYTGKDTQVVDLSNATSEEMAAIAAAADLKYLAQNTGVNTTDMEAAYASLGIDPKSTNAHSELDKVLKAAGYNPGEQSTFYGNNTANDVGAQILYDRWQDQPTEQDLIDAGLDPETVEVTNDFTANRVYLTSQLAKKGVSSNSTAGMANATAKELADHNKYMDNLLSQGNDYWSPRISAAGSYDEATLNMLEWDLIKKKKEKKTGVDTTGYTSAVGNVNLTGGVSQTGGNITGGGTPGVYQGPNFVSTPNISNVSPVMSSGTYEATLPTYEAGLGKQKTQFECRAIDQAKMYQPQTQAEKEALAATDPNYTAPAFENVMYRNRFGMTTYIQHINGVPSQPIPPGYYKVESFTDQSQTQAGSAAQGGNQGGLMQGQNQGGMIQGFATGAVICQNPQGKYLFYNASTGSPIRNSGNQCFTFDSADQAASWLSSGTGQASMGDYYLQGGGAYNFPTDYSTEGVNVNPALQYQPGGSVVQTGEGFKILYPDGTMSQGYQDYAQAQAAQQSGLSKLGLPDYNTYLQNQGIDPNLPGYNEQAYKDLYQTYLTDPASIEQAKVDQEAANLVEQTAGINADQPTGQTQVTAEDLAQYQRDLAAQAYAAPGGAVAASPVSYLDPNTYGSVIESTAGQALGTAPMVQEDQVAQIGSATQAIGPGYEGLKPMDYANMALEISTGLRDYDPRFDTNGDGTVTSADALAIANGSFQVEQLESEKAYVQPEASQYTANQAYRDVSQAVSGGTTTDYQGMADAVAGANWDVKTGTFNMNGQTFTPEQFIAANNLNLGDYMTTTSGMTAATSTGPSKTIDAARMQRQKVDPVTGEPMFTVDAEGNQVPVMETATSVSGMTAATGTAIEVGVRQKADPETGQLMFDAQGNPIMERVLPKRTLQEQIVDPVTGEVIQQGELITGTGVDQTKVGEAFGTGEVQAASVQGELANLMSQFEGGETPAWAAGSMRAASQMLAARGLGASSMAGQAVIQAAMEAALPIAQIDASNKQQVALFKAEQRAKFLQMDFDQAFQAKVMNAAKVSEIANMNFTAEQQIALENSKAANTMELQNLSNEQALVMAEAAALSQMDMANLNNRQQAAVQNAQNFLQIDMANLANEQQTALFKQQSLVNSILSDQAAANAAAQFNSTSENQTNQFFANLAASVSQFNAAQMNAMKQFNADEVNSLLEFNAGLQNQREMFNAQNYLVVAQANAQWRQNLATINTAAANESNMDYAQTVNGLTVKALDEIWQRERDLMDYSFTSSENAADRALSILLGDKQLEGIRDQLDSQEDAALGTLLTKIFFSSDFKSIFSPTEEE